MNPESLVDLIDRVVSNLKMDYSIIKTYTDMLGPHQDMHLDWSLAHMNVSLLEFIRDLERHQKYLNLNNNKDTDAS